MKRRTYENLNKEENINLNKELEVSVAGRSLLKIYAYFRKDRYFK